jgi:hypothetical protein
VARACASINPASVLWGAGAIKEVILKPTITVTKYATHIVATIKSADGREAQYGLNPGEDTERGLRATESDLRARARRLLNQADFIAQALAEGSPA